MKRLGLYLLAAAVTCLIAPQAYAQGAANGFYIGGGGGVGLIKLNLNGLSVLDDHTPAWKALLGHRTKNAAIEVDYRSLQALTATFGDSQIGTEIKGPALSGLFILPLGPVDLYGRTGWFRGEITTTIGAATESSTETNFFYGGGLGIRIGNAAIRAEYERLSFDGLEDIELLTGGITIAF